MQQKLMMQIMALIIHIKTMCCVTKESQYRCNFRHVYIILQPIVMNLLFCNTEMKLNGIYKHTVQ